MKFIVFIGAVFVLLWLLRRTLGQARGKAPPAPPQAPASPQQIIACAQCGVHLPRDEALPGQGGVFCGEAHRAAFEKERAAP